MNFTHTVKRERAPLKITIADKEIRSVEEVKFLGITLDRNLNLNRHCETIARKARSRLMRLCRSTGSNWGLNAESLRTIYLALIGRN